MATSLSLHPDWMGSKHDNDVGMLHRFKVQVGQYNLGGWQTVKGLEVKFDTEKVDQAGFNTYQVQLLKQPVWTDITLGRVVLNNEWKQTYEYLANALGNPQQAFGDLRPPSAMMLTIQIDSAWGERVRTLHFMNARARWWKGPDLSATTTQNVAIEQITFVHEGFFPDGDVASGPVL
jgi:phage tail-like protein